MAKVKRSERLTKMAEGAAKASEAAAARAQEILERAAAVEKRADEAARKVDEACAGAEKACKEAAENVKVAVDQVPKDPVKAEAEKVGVVSDKARKEIHEAAAAGKTAVDDAADRGRKAIHDACDEAMKPVLDAGDKVAKARDEAVAMVSAGLNAVQVAGEGMKAVISDLRALLEPLRKAVLDLRASMGSAKQAADRLAELRTATDPDPRQESPEAVREALKDIEEVAAEVDSHDPLIVGPMGG